MSATPQVQDLSGWIARIRGQEMPVFARTVEGLRRIIGDERASASALAQVILKDAPMTTKVLRLANSAFFNQSHQTVSTVSRAIVVLGFNPVAQRAGRTVGVASSRARRFSLRPCCPGLVKWLSGALAVSRRRRLIAV